MKKQNFLIYIIVLILTVYISCHKKETPVTPHTSVNGYVVNDYDGRVVPYAQVFLFKSPRDCGVMSGCAEQIATTKADTEGKFHFEFEWDADYWYEMNARALHYCHYGSTFIDDKGKLNKSNIKMRSGGWIKVQVKNVKRIVGGLFYLISINHILAMKLIQWH